MSAYKIQVLITILSQPKVLDEIFEINNALSIYSTLNRIDMSLVDMFLWLQVNI